MELSIIAGIAAVIGGGGAIGIWRTLRPVIAKWSAAGDVLVGKAPVLDDSGEVMEAGQPGLAHRLGAIEETVGKLVDQDTRLSNLELGQQGLNIRMTRLEDIREEQRLTREESAAMLRLAADRDVIDVDPDPEP